METMFYAVRNLDGEVLETDTTMQPSLDACRVFLMRRTNEIAAYHGITMVGTGSAWAGADFPTTDFLLTVQK